MRRALRVAAVVAAFGLTAWIGVVALAQGSSTPAPTVPTTTSPAATTSPAPTTGIDDVKGNCDEAEHANDPECIGANPVPEDDHESDDINDDDGADVNDDHGGDVTFDDQGDNEGDNDQGENEDDDDQGEDQGDDDQGDNSAPGSANSGPGSPNSGSGN